MMRANEAWINIVRELVAGSRSEDKYSVRLISPRGLSCIEMVQPVVHRIDPYYPLVTFKERKLSYRFAAAEALWIINGRNDVDFVARVNKNIRQFSDNGAVLAGAYGPKIINQLDYVVEKLIEDQDTRQATLTIWERNPRKSRDIPCTVAMNFMIRGTRLHCQVFMRSSDVYLGLPYDMFSFSMVMRLVLSEFKTRIGATPFNYKLGELCIYAASTHLYVKDLEAVEFTTDYGRHLEEDDLLTNLFNIDKPLNDEISLLTTMMEGGQVAAKNIQWSSDGNRSGVYPVEIGKMPT